MKLAALETYVAVHVASLEDSVKSEFAKFLAFVKDEEGKVKAEVAHLESLGWHVQPPQPDAPQAPDAAAAVS